MKKIIICRGISGSGKSTLAYETIINHKVSGDLSGPFCCFEADHWFKDSNNKYVFDSGELGNAHRWCQLSVEHFLRSYSDCIAIVSNTSTTYREILPYALLADKYDCAVEIAEPQTSWARDVIECHKRNTHGVPLETIKSQLARLEAHPIPIKAYTPTELLKKLKL